MKQRFLEKIKKFWKLKKISTRNLKLKKKDQENQKKISKKSQETTRNEDHPTIQRWLEGDIQGDRTKNKPRSHPHVNSTRSMVGRELREQFLCRVHRGTSGTEECGTRAEIRGTIAVRLRPRSEGGEHGDESR